MKQFMIYAGRPGLWSDYQRFLVEARKSRRVQEELAKRRRKEVLEYIAVAGIIAIGVAVLVAFVWWLYILKQSR